MDIKVPDNVHKKGANGSCLFWIIIYLLFAICVCNVILTLYLISVFEIGKGMRYIEVIDKDIMNFYGSIDLDHVYKLDGLIEGFSDPFEIENEKEPVIVNLISRIHTVHNKFRQESDVTVFQGIGNFEIRRPINDDSDEIIFNAQKPTFNIVEPVQSMISTVIHTNGKLTSDVDEKFSIVAKHKLDIKGSEGIEIKGRDILFNADKNLNIKSENGTISLQGSDGVFIDITRFPRADTENGLRKTHLQYKLCVCFPSGRLFQVQSRGRDSGCYIPQYSANPCI